MNRLILHQRNGQIQCRAPLCTRGVRASPRHVHDLTAPVGTGSRRSLSETRDAKSFKLPRRLLDAEIKYKSSDRVESKSGFERPRFVTEFSFDGTSGGSSPLSPVLFPSSPCNTSVSFQCLNRAFLRGWIGIPSDGTFSPSLMERGRREPWLIGQTEKTRQGLQSRGTSRQKSR